MKGKELIKDYKVGDRVVLKKEAINRYHEDYYAYTIFFLDSYVYGVMVGKDNDYPECIIVNWVNHKGMVIRRNWYARYTEIDLYEG